MDAMNTQTTLGAGSSSAISVSDVTVNVSNSSEEFSCLELDEFNSMIISESAWTISPSLHSSTPYIAIALFIVFLISFFWSLFIIVAYLVNYKKLRVNANDSHPPRAIYYFIGAIVDLLASLNIMLRFVTIVTKTYSHFGSNNLSLCRFCDLEGFFLIFLSSVGLHIRVALAFDRYIYLSFIFRRECRFWKGKHKQGQYSLTIRIVITVVLITMWSFFVAILPIAAGFGQYKFSTQIGACLPRLEGLSYAGVQNVYYCTFSVLIALILLLIYNASNIYIFCMLYKIRKQMRKQEHKDTKKCYYDNKINKRLVTFVISAIAWLPVIVIVLVVNGIPATLIPSGLFTFIWIIFLTNHFILSSIGESILIGGIASMIPSATRKGLIRTTRTQTVRLHDVKVRSSMSQERSADHNSMYDLEQEGQTLHTGITTTHTIPSAQRSKHHGIPFLCHEVYEYYGNKGQIYDIHMHGHDVTLRIPTDALSDKQTVRFEVGVAMYGPFNFPENIQPISPILWLNLIIDDNTTRSMKMAIQISLPHCLSEVTNKQICFIKTDIKEVDENGLYGNFTICKSSTDVHEKSGTLETSYYSGIFCMALLKSSASDCADIEYCLAQVNLLPSPPLYEFHFYALYNLATHMRATEMMLQKINKQVSSYTPFRFQPTQGSIGPLLKVVTESEQTSPTMEPLTRAISASDINFWKMDYHEFKLKQDKEEYPPRITVVVHHTGPKVSYPIRFEGSTNHLEMTVDLLSLVVDTELFEEAMQNGYVVLHTIVLLLIGVAGAGKTSFCHLVFDEPPPDIRKSTPLAQSSIRAVSFTRAVIDRQEEEVIWKRVSVQEFKALIAEAVKGIKDLEQLQFVPVNQVPLPQESKRMKPRDLLKRIGDFLQPGFLSELELDVLAALYNEDSDNCEEYELQQNSTTFDSSKPESKTPISKKVDHLFQIESVKQLLQMVNVSKGSVEHFRQEWLYLIDSGGQPQFHELLPTFIKHASAITLFVKLNEVLADHPMIEYYSEKGVPHGQPIQSSHTHMQTLQNCLQAMQARYDSKGVREYPELFFVGTHRDLENKDESMQSKNEQLLEMLCHHDVFQDHLAYYSIGECDQLLYPVNAKAPSQTDRNVVASFRQDVIRRCSKSTNEYKIPIRWFVLEIILQELSQDGIIGFKECCEIASKLGMDEMRLRAAIVYLTKLNIFEFFPTVLPNVVFTTSQVLLNMITNLVEYSYELHSGSSSHCDLVDIKFRDYGQISIKMLKRRRFSNHYIEGLFEVEDLVNLWVELLVIARGKDAILVMPAVLPELPVEELRQQCETSTTSQMVPLAIHYPGCLFPSGIFSSLISHLQNNSECKIMMSRGKPACLYKNCVKFSISGIVVANMTLIYSHYWIELHATLLGKEQGKASLLRDILLSGLNHAAGVQKYSDLKPELAFICPCESTSSSFPHLASPIAPDNEYMRCRRNESICKELTDGHTPWLGNLGDTGSAMSTVNKFDNQHTILNEHNHSVLYKQLIRHSAKWREIGTLLGFFPSELENIQARPLLLSGAPNSFLSAMLAEWLQWAPGDDRGSTGFPTLEALRVAIMSIQGLETVAKSLGI